MHFIRYANEAGHVGIGARREGAGVTPLPVPTLADLLALPVSEIRAAAEAAGAADGGPFRTLAPVDGVTEVWASGVTYRRSREARIEESNDGDVYTRVYDAQRPELFFKAPAWRVVADGEAIGVRRDSASNTPEPELALVLNAHAEIVGVTICNDVSSRSIEGENPLYLPQAKVYTRSCALGPGIRPIWEIADPMNLGIACTITRAGQPVWSAKTSTAALHRSFEDLVEHLFRALEFPAGVVLSTGTGIVPELELSLTEGDVVTIDIDGVGRLSNPVVSVPELG